MRREERGAPNESPNRRWGNTATIRDSWRPARRTAKDLGEIMAPVISQASQETGVHPLSILKPSNHRDRDARKQAIILARSTDLNCAEIGRVFNLSHQAIGHTREKKQANQ